MTTNTVTTAILTSHSHRTLYKSYIAQGMDEQDALKRANYRGYMDALDAQAKKPVAKSAPARRAPARRNDCVRGWEHDVE